MGKNMYLSDCAGEARKMLKMSSWKCLQIGSCQRYTWGQLKSRRTGFPNITRLRYHYVRPIFGPCIYFCHTNKNAGLNKCRTIFSKPWPRATAGMSLNNSSRLILPCCQMCFVLKAHLAGGKVPHSRLYFFALNWCSRIILWPPKVLCCDLHVWRILPNVCRIIVFFLPCTHIWHTKKKIE